jgi:hypothetical protein
MNTHRLHSLLDSSGAIISGKEPLQTMVLWLTTEQCSLLLAPKNTYPPAKTLLLRFAQKVFISRTNSLNRAAML